MDPESDIFVEFYAPWCSHCQEFEPTWKKLALAITEQKIPLVIAKMDASANDVIHPNIVIKKYPTILLFKRKALSGEQESDTEDIWSRKDVIPCTDRSTEGILSFLKKNGFALNSSGLTSFKDEL